MLPISGAQHVQAFCQLFQGFTSVQWGFHPPGPCCGAYAVLRSGRDSPKDFANARPNLHNGATFHNGDLFSRQISLPVKTLLLVCAET